jgi:hypothetical protein
MSYRHETIRSGGTLWITTPYGTTFLIGGTEAAATAIQAKLKDIDAELDRIRLGLYRDAFGDGTLGITDRTLLKLIEPRTDASVNRDQIS